MLIHQQSHHPAVQIHINHDEQCPLTHQKKIRQGVKCYILFKVNQRAQPNCLALISFFHAYIPVLQQFNPPSGNTKTHLPTHNAGTHSEGFLLPIIARNFLTARADHWL